MMQASPTARSCGLQCRLPYGLMWSHIPPSTARLPVRPGDLQNNLFLSTPMHTLRHAITSMSIVWVVQDRDSAGTAGTVMCRDLTTLQS